MYIEPNIPYIDKVYDNIKHAILFNQLKQGEILNERDLSAKLHVSRTPLSNALNYLTREGWLEKRGKSRAVVEITWKDIEDIYEIRVLTESFTCRKAAINITPNLAQRMKAMLDAMEEQFHRDKDFTPFLEQDRDWHEFINRIANNGKLNTMLTKLYEQFVRISFITTKQGSGKVISSMAEHRELAAAIARHDPEAASMMCEKHITAWFDSLKKNWDGEK